MGTLSVQRPLLLKEYQATGGWGQLTFPSSDSCSICHIHRTPGDIWVQGGGVAHTSEKQSGNVGSGSEIDGDLASSQQLMSSTPGVERPSQCQAASSHAV